MNSPTARRLLQLMAVRNAAVNLANTADDRGDRTSVRSSEFKKLIRAINRLNDLEDKLSDKHA